MSTPSIDQDGSVILDLSEHATRAARDKQLHAADVYMRTFTAARFKGATIDQASQQARAAFTRATTPDEAA